MNKLLWTLQILLAIAFLAHGIMMIAPPPEIALQMDKFLPRWFQLFLGVSEVLAAIGLTVPGFTRIQPRLVPAAAVGSMLVMLCATILHGSRGELGSAVTTLVLLLLATFVAYGRWKRVPIAARV